MIDLLNEKRIVFYLINSDNKINYGDNKEKDFFEIIDKNKILFLKIHK